jgi:hypothetical protein
MDIPSGKSSNSWKIPRCKKVFGSVLPFLGQQVGDENSRSPMVMMINHLLSSTIDYYD